MFRIGLRILREVQDEEDCVVERKIRRTLRDGSNPLELPNTAFIQHFRVNKDVFAYLLDVLKTSLPEGRKVFAVPLHIKLASCLRFFAEGAYQKAIGRDREMGIAQSTFSKILVKVLDALERKLCPKWVRWCNDEEAVEISQIFYERYKLPGVIGAVDGTHIALIPPEKNKHLYYNRKGFHSLNVMIVCDSKLRIMCINSKYPGSFHDSRIWSMSQCREVLRRKYTAEQSNKWLLGDAGYPLEPWLITPFRSAQPGTVEQQFNDVHSKCRNVVERTIGVLKNRWRCLLVSRQLHYCPKKAMQIVNVCAALHNICIAFNSGYEMAISSEPSEEPPLEDNGMEYSTFSDAAHRIRSNIANNL